MAQVLVKGDGEGPRWVGIARHALPCRALSSGQRVGFPWKSDQTLHGRFGDLNPFLQRMQSKYEQNIRHGCSLGSLSQVPFGEKYHRRSAGTQHGVLPKCAIRTSNQLSPGLLDFKPFWTTSLVANQQNRIVFGTFIQEVSQSNDQNPKCHAAAAVAACTAVTRHSKAVPVWACEPLIVSLESLS